MLIEQPGDFNAIDQWQYAVDCTPDLVCPPSKIGFDPAHTLGPAEYAFLFDIDGTHIGIVGRPAQLMDLAKRIQADLRSLRGVLELKARKANTWCMWCQQPIEHVRFPEGGRTSGPAAWWQHIVTCEVECGQAYTIAKKEASPLLTVHPCQHCHEPVAEVLNAPRPLPEQGAHHRWWWHLRNKVKVCNVLDPHPTQARPALGEQWTPRPDLDPFATDPWETKETDL